MFDPLLGASAVAIALLVFPVLPRVDPGPSPECPSDMRLVEGTHYDEIQHLCVDPRRDAKDTHCFAYWEGITAAEGPTTEIRVCMDQYEAPNRRGAKPFVMKSYDDARKWCGDHGKRPCAEREWELACEGADHLPLAYGWRVDRKVCNSDKSWMAFDVKRLSLPGSEGQAEVDRLWQGDPSGQHLACVSPFGIYDMMGNVEEWITSRKGRRYQGALMGGFWSKPWTGCRGTNDAHEPGFTSYETGFRCCAEPGTLDAGGKRKKKE